MARSLAFVTIVVVVAGCSRSTAPLTVSEPTSATDATSDATVATIATVDAGDEWRDVAGAADFAEPGATRVVLEVRRSGGVGCGGGGCSTSVDARALGLLPSKSFGYYYPDRARLAGARGCPDAADLAHLFTQWTAITIAPARGTAEQRPTCGLTTAHDAAMKYWIILRVGAANPAP